MYFKNKKNGKLYYVVGEAINVTNAQDGQKMYIYRAAEGDSPIYVRSIEEFNLKFDAEETWNPPCDPLLESELSDKDATYNWLTK